MKKRGSTHADWAISLGIFLVYTLSLFLLIQPGVEPVFRNENLVKIVEDSFVGDTRLVIEKTPIIFTPIEIIPENPEQNNFAAEIAENIPINTAVGFDITDFSIRDSNNIALPFEMDIQGNTITRIRVQANFSSTETTNLYLLYSPRAPGQQIDIYGQPTAPSGIIISENSRRIEGENRNNFTRIFGSTEVLSGINSNIISISQEVNPPIVETVNFPYNPLESFPCDPLEYTALKEQWNYPINKDFQIFVIPITNPRYTAEQMNNVCNQAQPYEQANVFVQDRIDNTLDFDGNKEPLRISMRVW